MRLPTIALLFAAQAIAAPPVAGPYVSRHTDLPYGELGAALQGRCSRKGGWCASCRPWMRIARRCLGAGLLRVLVVEPAGAGDALAGEPSLAALLPLRITVYAEGPGLVVSALRPTTLAPDLADPALRATLEDWDRALEEFLSAVP